MMTLLEKQESSFRFALGVCEGFFHSASFLSILFCFAVERRASKSCTSFVKDVTEEGVNVPSSQSELFWPLGQV